MSKSMFSNGSEYDAFMRENCFKCPMYVYYEETISDDSKAVCAIEERVAIGVEEHFPFEWLDKNNSMARFNCRKRLGLTEKTSDGINLRDHVKNVDDLFTLEEAEKIIKTALGQDG